MFGNPTKVSETDLSKIGEALKKIVLFESGQNMTFSDRLLDFKSQSLRKEAADLLNQVEKTEEIITKDITADFLSSEFVPFRQVSLDLGRRSEILKMVIDGRISDGQKASELSKEYQKMHDRLGDFENTLSSYLSKRFGQNTSVR